LYKVVVSILTMNYPRSFSSQPSIAVGLLVTALVISACASTTEATNTSEIEDRITVLEGLVEELSAKLDDIGAAPGSNATTPDLDSESDQSASIPEEQEDEAPSSVPSEKGKGTRTDPIPLGESAGVGDGWTLRINSVELDARDFETWSIINDPPPAGYAYVVVNISAGYTGPDAKSDNGVNISAVGASNIQISNDSFVIPPKPQYSSFIDVFAGGENSGNIVLTVPTNDLDSLLIYAEAFFSFDSSEVFFALK
jgi:hypothetical protein